MERSRTLREAAHWTVLVLTSGLALSVLYSLLGTLTNAGLHSKPDLYSAASIFVLMFLLLELPLLLIAHAVLVRDYFTAANVLMVLVALIIVGLGCEVEQRTGLQKWLMHVDSSDHWRPLLAVPALLLPFGFAALTYRLGCRCARRLLPARPLPPAGSVYLFAKD